MSVALFDSYLVVDWSAAGAPKRGKDSIWFALIRGEREGAQESRPRSAGPRVDGPSLQRLENPSTRIEAIRLIADLLAEERAAGRRVLAGFDFPFGYPTGVAKQITGDVGWAPLWRRLSDDITEGDANQTNRLAVAGALNGAWGGDGPFWGNGAKAEIDGLGRKKPQGYGEALPSEFRIVERIQHAAGGPRPKSVWQLAGAGAVGSQALTGVPALQRLRADPRLADAVQVWPFETGLAPPRAEICIAEVYPSLCAIEQRPGEPKDAAQVRATATRFAELDARGLLRPIFAGPDTLSADERRRVVAEEAWILGVGFLREMREDLSVLSARGAPPAGVPGKGQGDGRPALRLVSSAPKGRLRYERDPEAIYAESFATARREARVGHMPPQMVEVAVRMVHACGIPEIADRLAFSTGAWEAGRAALRAGHPVFCDCEMVASGIIRRALPAGNEVIWTLNDPRTPDLAKDIGNTRSAAAVELWGPR
ncbi:MAG: precorrin-8X methylmutase, partial [Pseudomonadota bacterium]